MAPYRAALLGSGFMAAQHCRRLLQRHDLSVCGVCGTTRDTARAFIDANRVDGAQPFDNYRKMIDVVKPDMLYVCIPPFAHNGEVEYAARCGVHLFLEKPMARTVERARSMNAAIAASGVVSQVGFHHRFHTSVTLLASLIQSGEAGRPTLFSGRFWCNFAGNAWWRDAGSSGGQVFEQVIHLYDLARYLLGRPVQVSGLAANLCHLEEPDYTIEDTSAGMVLFENGALATITGSNCAIPERFIGDFAVVCERVTLQYRSTGDWRDRDRAVLHFNTGKIREIIEDADPVAAQSADFCEGIAAGTPTRCPASDGVAAVELVSAFAESVRAGGGVVAL